MGGAGVTGATCYRDRQHAGEVLAAELVGAAPEACVFVDDLRENCEGAEAVGMTAIRGFGRSAIAQSRSTIACRSGASWAETIFAPEAARASLSDVQYWTAAIPTTITIIGARLRFSA